MSGYEDDIADVLLRGADPERASQRAELRYAVQTQIFDNETGAVLDVRRAVLVSVLPPNDKRTMEVFEADRYDVVADRVAQLCYDNGIELTVLDGRELFADEATP